MNGLPVCFSKFKLTFAIVLSLSFSRPALLLAQIIPGTNQPVFNHAALCAKNLKKTADFYSTVLQLQKIKHPFNDTLHVWFKIGEGLALHVIQGNCPETVHDISIHLCFSVPDLNLFMKQLDGLNVNYGNWNGEPEKVNLMAMGYIRSILKTRTDFGLK